MTFSSQATEKVLIQELRELLNGRVITPADGLYDKARSMFYGGIDLHPAVIAYPANTTEVAGVIQLARESGVELAVRSGGHSVAGFSTTEGGIVLDLKEMKNLEVNPEAKTAWAEAGLTAGEYSTAVNQYGLATGFGDTGSVGLGGITLGGGVGYLVRKHGLTIDNLLAAEIVTADGQILMIDEQHHPDLFWAIRGGGGNFGVVTRFQFRLHPIDTILGGMILLPATPDAIARFMAEAEAAPEALSVIANVMPVPPMPFLPAELHSQLLNLAMMVYAGDIEEGQRAIAPFRAIAKPAADMIRPMRYPEMLPPEESGYHPTAVSHTMFIDKVDLEDARMIMGYLHNSEAPFRVIQLRPLGGAMARIPAAATAFAHRQARVMVNLAAFYTSPEEKAVRGKWIADFAKALNQGYDGAYVNFISGSEQEQVRAAYPGATYERLARIKAIYDPTNLFRRNQNIIPAAI